jgi:copper chaperone CopZ
MKEKLSAAGAVVAAVLASSCCWAPLLLAGLGAGAGYPLAGGGFASALAPYRSYFMAFTVLFLVGAWYFTLRKRPTAAAASAAPGTRTESVGGGAPGDACCAQERCCAANGARRRNLLVLSAVTAFALAMLAFPPISAVLGRSRGPATARAVSAGRVETTTLAIKGMTCEACAVHLREALLKAPGVVAAEVDYRAASARVTFQQGQVSTNQLKQAVAKTEYRVTSATRSPASLPKAGK